MTEQSTTVATRTPDATEGSIVDTTYSIKADGYITTAADPGFRYGQTVTGTFEGRVSGTGISRRWDNKAARDYTLTIDSIAVDGEPGAPDGIAADEVVVSLDGRFELPTDPAYTYGQTLAGTFTGRIDGESVRAGYNKTTRVYRVSVTELVGEGIDASFIRPESVTDAADDALAKLDQLAKAVIRVPAPEPVETSRVRRAWKSFRRGPFGWVPMWFGFIALWVGITLTLRAVALVLG
jgi:hypothetical protein